MAPATRLRCWSLLVFGLVGCGATSAADPPAKEAPDGSASAAVPDGGSSGDAGGARACADLTPTASTIGVACTYSHDAFNASPSVNAQSTVQWACTSDARTVKGNGIPDHPTGTFPNANCPNGISAQTIDATLPIAPIETGKASTVPFSGYALNGVRFDPSTAGSCSDDGNCTLVGNGGSWKIEALGQSNFDFGVDESNAHVQPNGFYHYHGMPEALVAELAGQGKPTSPTLIGFAVDGFPVYARYGYARPLDAASELKIIKSSYQLKKSPGAGRPSVGTYPMGAFTEDYEYVAGSGDLDECNGRVDATPEFPCGIYHYYVTETYPFIQRCVKGTPQLGPGPGGGGDCGGCKEGEACCPSGQPCAGQCVPDCRKGTPCPNGLLCDEAGGFCRP